MFNVKIFWNFDTGVQKIIFYYLLKKEAPKQLFFGEYRKFFMKNFLYGKLPVAASENGWRIS